MIKKRKDETQELVYFVHVEDMFETIKRAHIATGHGGRDKMVKELSRYANVTSSSLHLSQYVKKTMSFELTLRG